MKQSVQIVIVILLVSFLASSLTVHVGRALGGELVGHWTFDQGSGNTAADSSGNSNTGTLQNNPIWVDGKNGKALRFDGIDDFVLVSDSSSLHLSSGVTVEAWIFLPSGADYSNFAKIVSKAASNGGTNLDFGIWDNAGHVDFGVGYDGGGPEQAIIVNSAGTVRRDVWTHVAATYDGSLLKIYFDGVLDSAHSFAGGINTDNGRPLTIGKGNFFPWSNEFWLNGTIDDVRIYDGALSQKEIQNDVGFTRGPQMDNLCMQYYSNASDAFNALKNGKVHITDRVLNSEECEEVYDNPSIQAAISPQDVIFEFDFNNNNTVPSYPDFRNPTSYKGFRQGIACLVDKDYIVDDICNYSYRIDTPVSRPNGEWWVNWNVSQYDSYGNTIGNYPYQYDSERAAEYFDQSGFVQGETINDYYDPEFPGSATHMRIHPATGEDLEPLIFYIRSDDPNRLAAGRLLRDNLRKLGIVVTAVEAPITTCREAVMFDKDYHIYTGGWVNSPPGPENLFLDMYTTALSYPSDEMVANYPQFRNATYDEWCEKVYSQTDLTLAQEAAWECQQILINEAACVWLYNPSHINGFRGISGVVNQRGGSIDNPWTFLAASPGVNSTTNTIFYGLSKAPTSLNIITGYQPSARGGIGYIYDTLLYQCPYDETPGIGGMEMPWMARVWELESWESPYDPGKNLTKLTFHLRDGIKWHDGIALNSDDIKFTVEYLKQSPDVTPNLLFLIQDVHHVETPDDRTVVVYENISDTRTLDYIGQLPILPKHIFQNITDVTGYTPGANEGHLANETLIGSGPWKYVFHNSTMLYLEANRDYFMETPPKAEVDFRYDWETGCWIVDAMDTTMVGEAYGTSGNGVPNPQWDPRCDMNGDCKVDAIDLYLVTNSVNKRWGESAQRYTAPPITDCAIYAEPLQSTVLMGQNHTIFIKMKSLTQLTGSQFKLDYDRAKLDCLNLNVNHIFGESTTLISKEEVNQVDGYIRVCASIAGTVQPRDGNVTLASITFNTTKPGGSTLHLSNTKLATGGTQGVPCQRLPHVTIDAGVMVGVDTPVGSDVTVTPAENVKVTFASTSSEGVTTLNVTQPPSPEFAAAICTEIKTTATYSGDITVQFSYDPTGLTLEGEQAMKIWLWDDTHSVWVDITTFVDTDKNIVYGVSPHLSMFGVTSELSVEGDISGQGQITASTPSDPPAGLEAMGLFVLKYYDIATTKTYKPPITIRFSYANLGVSPDEEMFVKLWTWNTTLTKWIDITTNVDPIGNIVYGVTSHLSMFGVTSLPQPTTEILVMDARCSKTSVPQGQCIMIEFVVRNQLDFTKKIAFSLYCNSYQMATYEVILGPKSQANFSYTWNTTGWVIGKYSLSVCGYVTNSVAVTIYGDIDGTLEVDIYDVTGICVCYDTVRGSAGYYRNADLDDNGVIDIFDVTAACVMYGTKFP